MNRLLICSSSAMFGMLCGLMICSAAALPSFTITVVNPHDVLFEDTLDIPLTFDDGALLDEDLGKALVQAKGEQADREVAACFDEQQLERYQSGFVKTCTLTIVDAFPALGKNRYVVSWQKKELETTTTLVELVDSFEQRVVFHSAQERITVGFKRAAPLLSIRDDLITSLAIQVPLLDQTVSVQPLLWYPGSRLQPFNGQLKTDPTMDIALGPAAAPQISSDSTLAIATIPFNSYLGVDKNTQLIQPIPQCSGLVKIMYTPQFGRIDIKSQRVIREGFYNRDGIAFHVIDTAPDRDKTRLWFYGAGEPRTEFTQRHHYLELLSNQQLLLTKDVSQTGNGPFIAQGEEFPYAGLYYFEAADNAEADGILIGVKKGMRAASPQFIKDIFGRLIGSAFISFAEPQWGTLAAFMSRTNRRLGSIGAWIEPGTYEEHLVIYYKIKPPFETKGVAQLLQKVPLNLTVQVKKNR